jgi:hypothetical protein
MKSILATVLIVLTTFVSSDGADSSRLWSDSALTDQGELQNFREGLAKILQFNIHKGRLCIDWQAWERSAKEIEASDPDIIKSDSERTRAEIMKRNPQFAAQMPIVNSFGTMNEPVTPLLILFRKLEKSAGSSSHMWGGGGSDECNNSFSGQQISGELRTSKRAQYLLLTELQPPRRTFELSLEGSDGFGLQIADQSGNLISLRQYHNGRFSIIALLDKTTYADQQESFAALVKTNRQWMSEHLLPALAQFGFQPISPPDSPGVRHAILTSLLTVDEIQAEGKRLLEDLDSDDYDVRDRATRSLSGRYDLYKDMIQAASQNQSNSPEVQVRLQNIIDQQPLSPGPMETAVGLDLVHDSKYIISLFDDSHSQTWPQIAGQLEKLTGQKLGTDPAAWKDWAKKNQE